MLTSWPGAMCHMHVPNVTLLRYRRVWRGAHKPPDEAIRPSDHTGWDGKGLFLCAQTRALSTCRCAGTMRATELEGSPSGGGPDLGALSLPHVAR